ncbi:MAG: ATP-binding cassette domain-containing protein [bacterium]|nr:ATP-binding cassette domain-containing protein [bacterium]
MISFKNVSKKFPDNTYGIVNLNLEIPDKDFVFLVGMSGAGKTTLLKLLTAQSRPTEGTILVNDLEVTKLKASQIYKVRREVGVVFQDFKLLPDHTVYENIALALDVVNQKEKNYKSIIQDLVQKVGLEGKEQYFPVQLSGGELQRTAIARALATNPKILVADEPTGDLDPTTAWGIVNLLSDINKTGTTIIMATHNHNIVDEMKKRVITIDHGRVSSDESNGGYKATIEPIQNTPSPIPEPEINIKQDKEDK